MCMCVQGSFVKLGGCLADTPNQGALFFKQIFIVTQFILFFILCLPCINFRLKYCKNKNKKKANGTFHSVSKGFLSGKRYLVFLISIFNTIELVSLFISQD